MKSMHSNGIPVRLLDLLETDGGWLTVDGIAVGLDVKPESVSRALYRLRNTGLVESRRVELLASTAPSRRPAGTPKWQNNSIRGEPGHPGEHRVEWRLV